MTSSKTKLSKFFYLFGLTTFFITVSDAYMAYFVPIVITGAGFSASIMGLLYGSSAVFGAIFDVILSKLLHNTHYKKMYFYTILLAACFPLFMFTDQIVWFYLLAMATWGLYFNLFMFGYYDFVAREEKKGNHAFSFGILYIFRNIGLIIGPLLATQLNFLRLQALPMAIPLTASAIAFALFIALVLIDKKKTDPKIESEEPAAKVEKPVSLKIWFAVGKRMWPILTLVLFLSVIDGIYWTVAPIIEKIAPSLTNLNAVLLIISIIPALFVARLVNLLTKRFGKKRTAFFSFLFSNILLLPLGYISNIYAVLGLVFLSTCFSSIVFPSVAGVIADFLKESTKYDGQILTARDFFANVGFAIGPIIAGILIDIVGSLMIFSYISCVGILVALLLLNFAPREINFHDNKIV